MLRRIIGIRSIANYARFSFSNRKPPKGFEKFDRPQLDEEQMKNWKKEDYEKMEEEHIEKMKDKQDEY